MLILTRHHAESFRIGDGVGVTVLEILPGRVRLGVECPLALPVLREELYQKTLREDPDRWRKRVSAEDCRLLEAFGLMLPPGHSGELKGWPPAPRR